MRGTGLYDGFTLVIHLSGPLDQLSLTGTITPAA